MGRLERRKADRVEWNTPGRIRLGSGRTLSCIVHNLSNGGARITAANIDSIPDEFLLELAPGSKRVKKCRVRWRALSELGVEFVAIAPAASKARSLRPFASARL